MHILFYRYGSICEPFIKNAFEKLGCTITEITEEIANKSLTSLEHLNLVSSFLQKNHCDFVFSINFYPIISDVCTIFKKIYVSWIVDCPVLELYSHSIRNPHNRIFIFDYAQYQDFRSENENGIFYLPLASDSSMWESLEDGITEEDKRKYCSDVSFIGSLYSEKCPYNLLNNPPEYLRGYLDGLIEAQLKIYGYNFIYESLSDELVEEFKKYIPFYQFPDKYVKNEKAVMSDLYINTKIAELERIRLLNTLSELFSVDIYTYSDTSVIPKITSKGPASSHIAMPKIFHFSKINLNITAKPIRTGLSLRIWDILNCGGFLISNYQEEIPKYFEVGKDLEIYSSADELIEKTNYYLNHEEERLAIAKSGYEKVKAYHQYTDRLKIMLEGLNI